MKLELVAKTDVSYVELLKNKKHLIGIKIKDATKSEAGPAIKKIKPKSPVARSFAAALGDIVLSVNGQLTRGKRKKDVIKMIKDAGACVNLELQYTIQEMRTSRCGVYRKQKMTTKLQKVNGTFGFLLRKKHSVQHCFCAEYPFVSNIKEGSQAHRNNQLQDGDRLISVDDLDVSWLTLAEIASILQDKDVAEFTFEYSIKVVNFAELEGQFDLEIDVPVSDLGLSFCMHSDSTMFISNIKMCSVAERCGVFCEGDIILSVNGIVTRYLNPPKADFLLGNAKKVREIIFIRSRRKEFSVMNASDQVEISSSIVSAEGDRVATESTSGIGTTDWKHVNTPASSNIAFSVQQNYFSQKFCHTEQMKVIDQFQHIVPVISSLKYQLSRLTHEAFNARHSTVSEICTFCTKSQHSINLCTSCLTRMNAKCEQSMKFLKSIVAEFVNFSTSTGNASPQSVTENETGGGDVPENQPIKASVRSLVITLTETLPKMFDRVPGFQESFEALAEKVGNADKSCSTCEFEVKSVMLIVKKLLLVISLNDNSVEMADLIERLVCCLFETKFTCDGKSEHAYSVVENECNISGSENLAFVAEDRNSLPGHLNNPRNSPEIKSSATQNGVGSVPDFQKLDTNTNLDYLRIVQSVSESQNSVSGNEVRETKVDMTPLVEMGDIFREANNLESSTAFVSSKDAVNNDDKNIRKDNTLKLPARVWRSLDSLLRPKKYARTQIVIRSREQDQCKVAGSGEVNLEAPDTSSDIQQSSTDDNLVTTENVSYSNDGSTGSSYRGDSANGNLNARRKGALFSLLSVRSETMEVRMKNCGDGFGLGISLRFVVATASVVPVIHAVRPNSPARKTGIIKVDDRVVAINHRSTLGLAAKDFTSLRDGAFLAISVILKIEFDVIDEEPQSGTFNVMLNRTLKTGLVFREMKKGSPMVVVGVVKGSAAHRCGQLYAGDEIAYLRCTRSEGFDSVSCNYDIDEKVHLTVQRGNAEGRQKQSIDTSPCYVNSGFSCDDFVPRNGTNYVVTSSAVRAARNSESMVYDQEVTLFRDLSSWDFGFLVGVDSETGCAHVTDIRPDGPAHLSGAIRKYDRIVEVNGMLVDRKVETSVVSLLAQANHKVNLLIRRLYHEASKRF